MDERRQADRIAVFEAANESLRELFVGAAPSDGEPPALSETIAAACLTHWQKEHKISCRIVRAGLALEEALKLVESHARFTAREGWTVLTE